MSSNLDALLFFNLWITLDTSSTVISSASMSCCATSVSWLKSKRSSGVGWFNTSLKCSIYLWDCSSWVSRTLPFLFLIGTIELLLAFVSSWTTLYRVFESFLCAASCASFPLSSIHRRLSFLQFFTSLSNCLYSSSAIFHSAKSFVWSLVDLAFFLWSITSNVPWEIHFSRFVPLRLPKVVSALSVTAWLNILHCSSWSVACCSAENLFLMAT